MGRITYHFEASVSTYYYGQHHPMKPHRVRMAHNLLVAYGLTEKLDMFTPPRATEKEITRFHADEYISFLKTVTPDTVSEHQETLARFNVLEDCPVFDGLWEYCQISAGGSLAGAARLNSGDADVAINWAGGLHHAKKAEASGFCYVNDCVLAILELLKVHSRVLYVDIDIHHGDGVEEAFYATDRVMTASFHKFGSFFPGTGAVDDIGIGRGKSYAVNFPLRDGINDESYREIFIPVMSRIMEWYRPGAVVLQCGADSLSGDRLGCFNLSLRGHAHCVDFFKAYDVPLLLLGGGGYTIRNVARCWAYETSRVLGVELADKLPYNENLEFYAPEFRLHIVPSNMENHNTPAELEKNKARILEHLRGLAAAPSVPIADVPRTSPLGVHNRDVDSDGEDPDVRHHRHRAKTVVEYEDSDDDIAVGDDILGNIPSARRRMKRPALAQSFGKKSRTPAPVVTVSRDVHSPPRSEAAPAPPPEPFPPYIPSMQSALGSWRPTSILVDPGPKPMKVVRGVSVAVADGDLTSHTPLGKADGGEKRRRMHSSRDVGDGIAGPREKEAVGANKGSEKPASASADNERGKSGNAASGRQDENDRTRKSSGPSISRPQDKRCVESKKIDATSHPKAAAKESYRTREWRLTNSYKTARAVIETVSAEGTKRSREGKASPDATPDVAGSDSVAPAKVSSDSVDANGASEMGTRSDVMMTDSAGDSIEKESPERREDVDMVDAPSDSSPVGTRRKADDTTEKSDRRKLELEREDEVRDMEGTRKYPRNADERLKNGRGSVSEHANRGECLSRPDAKGSLGRTNTKVSGSSDAAQSPSKDANENGTTGKESREEARESRLASEEARADRDGDCSIEPAEDDAARTVESSSGEEVGETGGDDDHDVPRASAAPGDEDVEATDAGDGERGDGERGLSDGNRPRDADPRSARRGQGSGYSSGYREHGSSNRKQSPVYKVPQSAPQPPLSEPQQPGSSPPGDGPVSPRRGLAAGEGAPKEGRSSMSMIDRVRQWAASNERFTRRSRMAYDGLNDCEPEDPNFSEAERVRSGPSERYSSVASRSREERLSIAGIERNVDSTRSTNPQDGRDGDLRNSSPDNCGAGRSKSSSGASGRYGGEHKGSGTGKDSLKSGSGGRPSGEDGEYKRKPQDEIHENRVTSEKGRGQPSGPEKSSNLKEEEGSGRGSGGGTAGRGSVGDGDRRREGDEEMRSIGKVTIKVPQIGRSPDAPSKSDGRADSPESHGGGDSTGREKDGEEGGVERELTPLT